MKMIISAEVSLREKKENLLSFILFIQCIKVPPYYSLLTLTLKFQTIQLYISSQSEFPRNYKDLSMKTLFSLLDINTVIELWMNLLLESKIIIIGNKPDLLFSVIDTMIKLLFPFEWQFNVVTCLPKSKLDIMELPFPYIIGVLSQSIDYEDLIYTFDEHCLVNCNTGEIISQLDKCLPMKIVRQLKAEIQYLKNSDLLQEDAFVLGEEEENKFTHINLSLSFEENIRKIFYNALNKSLCLTEYKKFLDLTTINEEIEKIYRENDRGDFIYNSFKKEEYIDYVIKTQESLRKEENSHFENFLNQLTITTLFGKFLENSFLSDRSPNFESYTKIYETLISTSKPNHSIDNCFKMEMTMPMNVDKDENEEKAKNKKENKDSFRFYSDKGIIPFLKSSIDYLEKYCHLLFDKIVDELDLEFYNSKEKFKKCDVKDSNYLKEIKDVKAPKSERLRSNKRCRRFFVKEMVNVKVNIPQIIKFSNDQIDPLRPIGFSTFCLFYLFYLEEVSNDLSLLLNIYHKAFSYDEIEFPYSRYFLLLYKLSDTQLNDIENNSKLKKLQTYVNFYYLLKTPFQKKKAPTKLNKVPTIQKFTYKNTILNPNGIKLNTSILNSDKIECRTSNLSSMTERKVSNSPVSKLTTLQISLIDNTFIFEDYITYSKSNETSTVKKLARKIKKFITFSGSSLKQTAMSVLSSISPKDIMPKITSISLEIEKLKKIPLGTIVNNKPATWLNLFNSLLLFSFLNSGTKRPITLKDWFEIIENTSYNIGGVNFKLSNILSNLLNNNNKENSNDEKIEIEFDSDNVKVSFDNINTQLLCFGIYFPIKDDVISFSVYDENKIKEKLRKKAKKFFEKAICYKVDKLWVNEYLKFLIPEFFENNNYNKYAKYINKNILEIIKKKEKEFSIKNCNWEGFSL